MTVRKFIVALIKTQGTSPKRQMLGKTLHSSIGCHIQGCLDKIVVLHGAVSAVVFTSECIHEYFMRFLCEEQFDVH
jgi:hypothetical protein